MGWIITLAQSANLGSDCAIPMPGNAPARSIEDLTVAEPGEDLAQLAVDAMPQVPSIKNAIDQLTADLAAFCIDQLESTLIMGNEEYQAAGTNHLEDELQVRFKTQIIYDNIPMLGPFRMQRSWQRGHRLQKHIQ